MWHVCDLIVFRHWIKLVLNWSYLELHQGGSLFYLVAVHLNDQEIASCVQYILPESFTSIVLSGEKNYTI